MLNAKGTRELAYVVTITDVQPIEGYDRVEEAMIRGWHCVVGKGDFRPGDKAVYFEIDSKVPETDERFAFLENKHYKIRTGAKTLAQISCDSTSAVSANHTSDTVCGISTLNNGGKLRPAHTG